MNLAKIAYNPEPSLTDPEPTTLAVKVSEQLRRDIRSCSLVPGQPLRIEWLKAHHQTGVSPTREALARLATAYFVIAEGKRGYIVSERSETDFDQLFKIRRELETRAFRYSMENGDDDREAAVVASFPKLALTMPPRSKIPSKIVREIETEHQKLIGFTIERNTEKASALLVAHRSRTCSAIKKQFLIDSRTTESCI